MHLQKSLEAHLKEYAGDIVTIKHGVLAKKVEKNGDTFTVTLDNGETAESKAVLVASGSKRRTLGVPGADTFEHKGLPTALHVTDHCSLDVMSSLSEVEMQDLRQQPSSLRTQRVLPYSITVIHSKLTLSPLRKCSPTQT